MCLSLTVWNILGERPVWSMSGGEMLSTLDQVDAVIAHLEVYRLQVIAGMDEQGYAQELGAHDMVQLLAFRYRLDRPQAYRDVRLARALPKYATVSTALADGMTTPDEQPDTDVRADDGGTDADDAADVHAAGRLLRQAQAEAIVSALERFPTRVPVEHLAAAEEQLVRLARRLTPNELRKAGKELRDLLDSDGPEPEEHNAYTREELTLSPADNGVKFNGYLASENAELLRSLIHQGAGKVVQGGGRFATRR